MKSARTVNEVISLVSSGNNPKFLFFWGHKPHLTGEVTKACFSQWWESPFEIDGLIFPTAEHYMMWAKSRLFGDITTSQKIMNATHPKQAKELGRSVIGFVETIWLQHRFDIVVTANDAKFRQNPRLSEFLLSTGDRVLVEASPVDRVWGIGLAADDVYANSPKNWRGLNLLGFALMEVRDRLRSSLNQ